LPVTPPSEVPMCNLIDKQIPTERAPTIGLPKAT
jgi:hypothetical protein